MRIVLNLKLVFLIVLSIVFFEGAFRKWILGSLGDVLILVRDLVAISFILVIYLGRRVYKINSIVFLATAFSVVVFFWGMMQLIFNQSSIFLYLIGFRFWVLYVLLYIFLASYMSIEDIKKVSKIAVRLMMIATPLVVMQHLLPPSHILNYQIDTDVDKIFKVSGDIVRTSGTFSFVTGYSLFLSVVTPIVLTNKIAGLTVFDNNREWIGAICSLVICIAVSGSRTAFVAFAILFITWLISVISFPAGRVELLRAVFVLAFLIIAVIGSYIYLGDAFLAIEDRFQSASQTENFYDRLKMTIFGINGIDDNFVFLGNGLGVGTNFAGYLQGGARIFLTGESEPDRIIAEGGFLGITFIFLKILMVIYFGYLSIIGAYKKMDGTAIVYCISGAVAIFTWPMLAQLSVNALGPMAMFFMISACRDS